jgi:hypothetical protein
LSVQFTPTVTANYNTPAAKDVSILMQPVGSSNISAADSYPLTLYQGAGWGNPPADGISANDLIDASQATFYSITNHTTPLFSTSNTALNDGLHYPFTCYGEGGGFTVTFDTSVNTAGYDISSIISYSANQDSADRISQKYDVEYHVVGGGGTWTHLSGDAGATVDRLFMGSHANNGVDIGGTMAVTLSGLGLTGVDQLRFTTHKNSCADPMEFLFTEIDVSGTVTVASPNTYAIWAAAQMPPVTGGVNGDANHDGLQNGIAYFMNDPGAVIHPGLNAGNTVTWTNGGNLPKTEYGTRFVVQTSTTLDHWDEVPVGDTKLSNLDGAISYTLPAGAGKVFVRLLVTP